MLFWGVAGETVAGAHGEISADCRSKGTKVTTVVAVADAAAAARGLTVGVPTVPRWLAGGEGGDTPP